MNREVHVLVLREAGGFRRSTHPRIISRRSRSVLRRRATSGPAADCVGFGSGIDDRTADSERIGNTQLIINDLPVLQVF
jgi:hypothetical protein